MGMEKKEMEMIFAQSRETIQEISGWKMFVFLPQTTTWRFLMIAVVTVKCIYNFTRAFYLKDPVLFTYVDRSCDIMYYADVILSTMHFSMTQTRKLRHGKRRPAIFLLIDFISIIPLEEIYNNTVFSERAKDKRVGHALHLVGALRLYQVPKNFSDVKDSIYKMKIYVIVTILQVLCYIMIITHFLSCFIFLYFDEAQKEKCLKNFLHCVMENTMETFYLLSQCYMQPYSAYPLQNYSVLLMIDFLFGYVFTYGYLTPLLLFVSTKFLLKYFEYAKQLRRINVVTANLVKDKHLRRRVLDYFHELWTFGRCDKPPDLLDVFPLGLKKNIFCDMHWEAMRHSYLIQGVSIGCKRSLAMRMRTQFLLPHTKVFEKNVNPNVFLYLETGMLQVMAEENSQTPVLNLTEGTVLGEMSFFIHINSLATVRAGRYSVIHTLPFRDFFQVLMDYPSDKKMILSRLKERLKFAKSMYHIKINVFSHFMPDAGDTKNEEGKRGNIKWIKGQYRAICNLKHAEKLLNMQQYTIDDYERQVLKLDTQMKHTSVCLPYICINDAKINIQETVCLKKFPWLMDPECQFVCIWKRIVCLVVVITVLMYPAFIAFFPHIPKSFFCLSCVVTLIYIIDIFLNFTTAIRVKNVTIDKFSSVFVARITNILFIADLVAAFPLQVFIYEVPERYGSNLYFTNALFKVYLLIPIAYQLNYSPKPLVFIRTLTKYIVFMIITVYISAAVFYLSGVECIFYDCGDHDWYQILVKARGKVHGIETAFLRAVYLGYQIPEEDSRTGNLASYYILWTSFFLFHAFYYALNGECTAAYVLEQSYDVDYKNRMDFLYEFMGSHKMTGQLRNRVMSTLQFQFSYDKNNYITDKEGIWKALSEELNTRIHRSCILPTVSKSRLFESEDEDLLMALAGRFKMFALPANSLLVTLGSQTTRLYIVHKGFVQVNSFIAGDLNLNTSRAITIREGDTFPVLDVLSQTPSSVTAVTVTECELIVIELEDLLSELMIHGAFKDFVETVQETDLSKLTTARLGVSGFPDVFSVGGVPFKDVLRRIRGLETVLKFILKKTAINSHSTFYLYWELSRVVFSIIYCITWAIALGCCHGVSAQPKIFEILSFSELLSVIDFYIRLNVAYYNKLGIYVSHTFATAVHYLGTAFIADFIAFSPNFHIWYIIINNAYNFTLPVVVIHMILRSFSLYRYVGYLRYLKVYGKVIYSTWPIIAVSFIALLIHYYICCMVLLFTMKIVKPKVRLTVHNQLELQTPYEHYVNELGLILALALRSLRFINYYDLYSIIFTLGVATLGLVGQIWLFSQLTLNSTSSNKSLTAYKYYMQSFINYLVMQKADDKVINQAVEHFEFEWQEYMGNDLYEICSSFPHSVHEDITYPLYKKTLAGVASLSKANEYFYRVLSRNMREVYLKEGCIVLYQQEVQSNIYFLHTGICSIENSTKLLYKGSMMGDIKQKGIMKNTIMTVIPTKLLKIPSKIFFEALNNFYKTKLTYQEEVAEADDFLVSIFVEEREDFSAYPLERELVECEFVPYTDEQEGEKVSHKKRRCYMDYNSKVARILRFFFMITAYCSVITVPILMSLRVYAKGIVIVIYVMDFIWLIKLIVVPRMISTDEIPRKRGKKMRRFILSMKIIFHTLTIFPIEVLPLIHYGLPITEKCCFIMCLCYVNRMLRFVYIFQYFRKKGKRLLANYFMNVFGILLLKLALINISCALHIIALQMKDFQHFTCFSTLNDVQKDTLVNSYLCVINDFMGAGMHICLPDTSRAVFFQLLIAVWSLLSKAFFINHVLMIIYVTHHNKANQMVQLEQLDQYLSVFLLQKKIRDVSPILRSGAQKYFCNLLNSFYEGAETSFLNSAPSSIRTNIMQNIYMSYISNCFLFRDVEDIFIKQLTTRLCLNIFFPGDYIAEKGDVDHNMYFIQSGEVYCIQIETNFKALERATDLYFTGTSFGIPQGILPTCPHTQTYRAKTLTKILVLNYDNWEDLRLAFPETFENMFKICQQVLT